MVVRHWSLYESMLYSTYVASRLNTWKVTGRERLELLTARMGLSLKEMQEPFSVMPSRVLDTLKDRMLEFGPQAGLDQLLYPSFHMRLPFRAFVSASDMVYALIGLLQRAPSLGPADVADPAGHEAPPAFDYRRHQATNVFKALDAFAENRPERLQEGIQLSIEQQKAVVCAPIKLTTPIGHAC